MRGRLTALLLVLSTGALVAQTPYVGFEQVTVANAAIGLTTSKILQGSGHPQANYGECRLETAEIRYTIDGTTPTTTVGTVMEPGDILQFLSSTDLLAFRAIRTGGTSGLLDCHYWSEKPR